MGLLKNHPEKVVAAGGVPLLLSLLQQPVEEVSTPALESLLPLLPNTPQVGTLATIVSCVHLIYLSMDSSIIDNA
jgi:hypothetical protein